MWPVTIAEKGIAGQADLRRTHALQWKPLFRLKRARPLWRGHIQSDSSNGNALISCKPWTKTLIAFALHNSRI